jgi:hypothetical protein
MIPYPTCKVKLPPGKRHDHLEMKTIFKRKREKKMEL